MRLRGCGILLVMLTAAPAHASGWEFGLTGWYSVPIIQTFGPRPELQFSGEVAPWSAVPALRLRSGFRVAGPVALRGNALGYDSPETLATFVQLSPSFMVVGGWELGAVRVSTGFGLSYHVRLTQTADAAKGLEIVPGQASFGHVERFDFTDHPGIEALVEGSVPVSSGLRVSLGAGFSHGSVRLLVVPRENAEVVVGLWRYMTVWSVQAGVRW